MEFGWEAAVVCSTSDVNSLAQDNSGIEKKGDKESPSRREPKKSNQTKNKTKPERRSDPFRVFFFCCFAHCLLLLKSKEHRRIP